MVKFWQIEIGNTVASILFCFSRTLSFPSIGMSLHKHVQCTYNGFLLSLFCRNRFMEDNCAIIHPCWHVLLFSQPKYFDSGDYNMAKAKIKNKQIPAAQTEKAEITGDHIPTPQDLPQRKPSLVASKLAGWYLLLSFTPNSHFLFLHLHLSLILHSCPHPFSFPILWKHTEYS